MKLQPFAWIIVGGLVSGCSGRDSTKDAASETRHAQRKQSVQAVIQAGPQTTSWETPQGTVIALDIPKASLGGSFVEVKHCIVWRDAVTKTSALHCDKDELDTRDYPSDPPEIER